MQAQQPNNIFQAIPSTEITQAQSSPKAWAKPTFERVPLNNALATFSGSGSTDNGYYAS